MDRSDFLERLMNGLADLTPAEREQVEAYYTEILEDALEGGQEEETVLASLGSPEEAARKLLAEYGTPAPGIQKEEPQDGTWEYTARERPREVVVEAQNAKVTLVPVVGGTAHLRYEGYGPEVDTVSCTEVEGLLHFSQQVHETVLFQLFRRCLQRRVTIELPSDFKGTIRVVTQNERIVAEGFKFLQTLDCRTKNAKITLSDLGAEELRAQTKNAAVEVSRTAANTLLAQASNAALRLKQVAVQKRLEGETTNAGIHADDCAGPAVALSTTNGTLHVSDLLADDIRLQTKNAAIHARIRGEAQEFSIEAYTSNANSNLVNTRIDSRPKCLRVHTTNGAIDVKFVP